MTLELADQFEIEVIRQALKHLLSDRYDLDADVVEVALSKLRILERGGAG